MKRLFVLLTLIAAFRNVPASAQHAVAPPPGKTYTVVVAPRAARTYTARVSEPDGVRSYTVAVAPTAAKTYTVSIGEQDRAYLGIYSGYMSEEKARLLGFDNAYGSYISRVIPNSAAEKAGLKPFDYVFGIDEYRTSDEEDLTDLLKKFEPGQEVTIHYIRSGEIRKTRVALGEAGGWTNIISGANTPFLGVSQKYDEEKEEEEGDDAIMGVTVEIIKGSTAEEIGLRDGDVILKINAYPMVDWTDITTAIQTLKPGETIEVEYDRDGKREKASGKIKPKSSSQAYSTTPKAREEGLTKITPSGKDRDEDKDEDYEDDQDRQGEYAFLGIQSNNISEEKAKLLGFDNAYGSYVTKVIKGTSADRAGLMPFDYIFGVDEYRTGEGQNLSQIMRKFAPGDKATIHLIRRGQKKTLATTLGRRTDSETESADRCQEPFFGIRHDHRSNPERGVGVTIVDNSTAKAAGLQDGDIITSINDYPIIDWEDITAAVDNMKVGEKIMVDYLRGSKKGSGSATIKSYCDTRPAVQSWGVQPRPDINVSPRTGPVPRPAPQPRIDPNSTSIRIEDVSVAEADEIKGKSGAELASRGNLRIEKLRLTPAGNRFRLEFDLPQSGNTSVRIFNASGRQIYNYDLGAFSGAFSDEVDLGQNGTGSYYLLVKQGDKLIGKKIVLAGK